MHSRISAMIGTSVLFALVACSSDATAPQAVESDVSEVSDIRTNEAAAEMVSGNAALTSLSSSATVLPVGRSLTLSAPDRIARSRGVMWWSSNTSVVTVTGNGRLNAVREGTAVISAVGFGGIETWTVFALDAASATLTVSPSTTQLKVGEESAVDVSLVSKTGVSIDASSAALSVSNSSVARLSGNRRLVAVAAGSVQLRSSLHNVNGATSVQVQSAAPAPTLSVLSISPKSLTVAQNGSVQFYTTALWSAGGSGTPALTYSATGGTINASTGAWKAPATSGVYRIIVAHTGGTKRDTATITVSAPTATALTLTPGTATLSPGATQQYSATTTWSDGQARSSTTTYKATGGTISANGLYTAGQAAGTFAVIASCICGVADTSVVTISAPQLAKLTIAPKTVSVVAGGTQQFSVSANWSTGATTVPPVSYSAPNGGTVSSTGLFTAPATTGTFRVVVAHTGGTRRDTALVTVTAPAPTPIPTPNPVPSAPNGSNENTTGGETGTLPVPTSFTPNLPVVSGLQQVLDTRFEGLRSGSMVNGLSYVWDGRLTSDPTGRAAFGSNVFETFYPGNSLGNGVGGAKIYGPENQRWSRIYFSMAVFFPSNYVMHSNGEKFWYPLLDGQTANFFLNLHPLNASPTGSTFGFNWVNRPGEVATGQTSGALVRKGEWQLIEVYMEISSPNAANGILRTWVNGQPAVNRSDVQYYSGSTQRYFDGIRFDGTRGGGASSVPTPSSGQSRFYNRLSFFAGR